MLNPACAVLIPLLVALSRADYPYLVDDSLGTGREFDGIGGISGGGATSKLLIGYKEPYRSQILDYLFKPNFGASLQILKVEIGGDCQSAEGVEASHMHNETDENYRRGYEWWLMKEAKKRNAAIKLYGLPWTFPGWLGKGTSSPYSNRTALVRYITNWIHGAANVHNLTIDYIGIWNERPYDVPYIKMLRHALDMQGLRHVRIVAADREWDFVPDMLRDPQLADSVDVIGVHYPGTHSPPEALATDRKLWASEEYSAYNDVRGGGCWARVLNEGYVNGYLTSNIAWNLIASYYDQLPYTRNGLMTAVEPWSGHYEVNSPIWISAHHTQFIAPGWRYLLHDYGVGNLTGNGTYVALTSPDAKHLTIVMETMDPNDAPCFYSMPKYNVSEKQSATFQLRGSCRDIKSLYVWFSKLYFDGNTSKLFMESDPIDVVDGRFTLMLEKNCVYTLTTLSTGSKGDYGQIPDSAHFPNQYVDDFESYEVDAEPYNFAQQAGAFEVHDTGSPSHGKVIKQAVLQPGIDVCLRFNVHMHRAITIIGNYDEPNAAAQFESFVPSSPDGTSGVFLALRVDRGSCGVVSAKGIYFWVYPAEQKFIVSGDFNRSHVYTSGSFQMSRDQWFSVTLAASGETAVGLINNVQVFERDDVPITTGFTALGTENYGLAYFDNFGMLSTGSFTHGSLQKAIHSLRFMPSNESLSLNSKSSIGNAL